MDQLEVLGSGSSSIAANVHLIIIVEARDQPISNLFVV